MKVLYIAAECKPLSKAGGVGDVAGELPAALKSMGVDIEIVTPFYGRIMQNHPGASGSSVTREYFINFHDRAEQVKILSTNIKGVPVSMVKNRPYFETDYSRGPVKAPFEEPYLFRKDYSRPYVDSREIPFYDDALRFSFFSEACVPLILEKAPDIVHVNDWVLGYLLARMKMRGLPQKRVLTVHNMGYQGNIYQELIRGWDIQDIARHQVAGPLFMDPRSLWKSVNALRLGMELAHRTNTVSPTYKMEITRPEDPSRYFEGGRGLDEVAASLNRQGRLYGILNGFEYDFSPDDAGFEAMLDGKARMKALLAENFPHPRGMLFGFVGRAVEQKFKLLTEELKGKSVLEHILDIPGVNVAVLATGDQKYETFLRNLSGRPNMSATIAFDAEKAGQISLGSDVFLMPSLFEPCGITQMESLGCATPPLVRWTGGLADTVRPHTQTLGTGFGFDGRTRKEVLENLVAAAGEAALLYGQNRGRFQDLQRNGFYERFLWASSAEKYIKELYEPAMAGG